MEEVYRIKLSIIGDICPTNDTIALFDEVNVNELFNDVLPIFRSCDINLGNLEFVLSNEFKPIKKSGPLLFGKTSYVKVLEKAGIKLISLANNHINDGGAEGIKSTIESLKNYGIDYFGAGENLDYAKKPYIASIKGLKIGFISFAEQEFNVSESDNYGSNYFDPFEDLDLIRELKKQVDHIIILFHGGIEYYKYPSPLLQKKCRKMIDAGADLITCQHSHCIGTIEEYKGKKIIYGQGNFVYGYKEGNTSWNHGLLLDIKFTEEKLDLKLIPTTATKNGIKLMQGNEKETLLNSIIIESKKLTDRDFVKSAWEEFCNSKKTFYFSYLLGFNRVLIHINRLLNNRIVSFLYSKKRLRTSHNIIRCESHNEVVQTILKEKTK